VGFGEATSGGDYFRVYVIRDYQVPGDALLIGNNSIEQFHFQDSPYGQRRRRDPRQLSRVTDRPGPQPPLVSP
jgi:hypothetical protein